MAAALPPRPPVSPVHTAITLLLALLALAAPASAQWLPDQPVRLFDGRLRLAGDVAATAGTRDDDAFFNYTDYERNALRTVRLGLAAEWRPAERVAVLGEVRTDDFERLAATAAYVRIRPVAGLPLDVQAGRIPPVFGSFARRPYAADRMLIGYPLAYQYLTSLRADAVPLTADDLLRMRGRGWRSSFPAGAQDPAPGLPLVSAFRWDTGVQARWSVPHFEAAAALTQGTLSNPRVVDDNGSRQVAGRIEVRPLVGLRIGASAARGGWISRDVPGTARDAAQTAAGADVEYSAGHLLVRAEGVWSRWAVPFSFAPPEGDAVSARAGWIEGRYRVHPRLYLAARGDALAFSRLTGSDGAAAPWDAGVRRVELGAGFLLQRNVVLRTVAQINRREGGRVTRRTFVSSQVAWWF